MSVVVRAPNGKILVMCKGADNVILARSTSVLSLPPSSHPQQEKMREQTDPRMLLALHLEAFATDGLRTLVLAKRELDVETFKQFQCLWSQAEAAIIGRCLIIIGRQCLACCGS
jgi:magnesium-transporting ATPase (P-type)